MNCEHWEQHLYLYRELNAEEQAAINRHVATCLRCRALLDAVQQQYTLTHRAAAERPEPADATRLTGAIMAAITPAARPRQRVMDSPWLRCSMAAASVLLIAAFLFEHPWTHGAPAERVAAAPPPRELHSPVMNTRAFIEAQQQKRVIPERSRLALYASCMWGNDCDDTTVRNFKNKMKL